MDAEAAEEWTVRCRMPQPSSKSRQTVGASHALPLVEVPTAGPPATEGAAGRAAANLVCAYPVQSGHRGDRTTLPSESYIDAPKNRHNWATAGNLRRAQQESATLAKSP